MSDEQILAVCQEARTQGLRVLVHVYSSHAIMSVAQSGCTSVEHGTLIDDEALRFLAAHGTYFDPNIGVVAQNYVLNKDKFIGTGGFTEDSIKGTETRAGLGTTPAVFWESIGSRITVTATSGTSPIVNVQPYPTYYVYVNGQQKITYPEASDPHNQFQPNPYPFGTVPCAGLFPLPPVPGGRCGNAVLPPDSTARIPPVFCITGSNGSCN